MTRLNIDSKKRGFRMKFASLLNLLGIIKALNIYLFFIAILIQLAQIQGVIAKNNINIPSKIFN